jgi:GTP cyclohydrolase IA
MNSPWIEETWKRLLSEIGDDPERAGLVDTPKRVAKMFKEIFSGYNPENMPIITTFPVGKEQGLVIDKGYYFSMCEHHMLPFFGPYYFGYIPNKHLIGASKIARVVDYCAARLQIAEQLCCDVATIIEEAVKPRGLVLIMSGRHLCKEMRGVKKYQSDFEAIEVRGSFLENTSGCKDEFMSRIGMRV